MRAILERKSTAFPSPFLFFPPVRPEFIDLAAVSAWRTDRLSLLKCGDSYARACVQMHDVDDDSALIVISHLFSLSVYFPISPSSSSVVRLLNWVKQKREENKRETVVKKPEGEN